MRKTILSLTLTLISAGAFGAGNYLNGSQLLEFYSDQANYDTGVFDGYVTGIVDFNKGFCVPEEVTSIQLSKVVLKYLTEHPDQLHFSAASLVVPALEEAYPCKID